MVVIGVRGIRAAREDTHALRLKSKLFDLRAGYANPSFALLAKHWVEAAVRGDKKTDHRLVVCFFMAAELGFEPRHTESESAVLPLHNSAKYGALISCLYILAQKYGFVKYLFAVFYIFFKNVENYSSVRIRGAVVSVAYRTPSLLYEALIVDRKLE